MLTSLDDEYDEESDGIREKCVSSGGSWSALARSRMLLRRRRPLFRRNERESPSTPSSALSRTIPRRVLLDDDTMLVAIEYGSGARTGTFKCGVWLAHPRPKSHVSHNFQLNIYYYQIPTLVHTAC